MPLEPLYRFVKRRRRRANGPLPRLQIEENPDLDLQLSFAMSRTGAMFWNRRGLTGTDAFNPQLFLVRLLVFFAGFCPSPIFLASAERVAA